MANDTLNISGGTRLLAILADPVAQVRSPQLVNDALMQRGRAGEAVMVPFHVTSGGLEDAIRGLRAVRNFAGAVVTMPHKQAIVRLLDGMTDEARQVGACNVIRCDADGRLVGNMLDGEGLVRSLRKSGYALAGRRALLVGAGGAASAIAFALGRQGIASLTIRNRTAATTERLAERVRAACPGLPVHAAGAAGPYDLAINATPLGMRPDDPLPADPATLDPAAVAADLVVAPEVTAFLHAAAARGCAIHPGRLTLAAQIDAMIDFMLA